MFTFVRRFIVIGLVLLTAVGCMGEFYGYTQAEWASMSEKQKDEAKKNYAYLVSEKNKQVHGNKIEEATTELAKRANEEYHDQN